jgi:pimeloyl-ACP methyl ester carboxylesterase
VTRPSEVEYSEHGQGESILFVPGSFGTGAGWRPVIKLLGDHFRFITTSLLGYGATVERRTPANGSIDLQIDVLEGIARRAAAPVHIVAHSYGGLCVLALALRRTCEIRSLTLVEANPFDLLRQAGESDLYQQFGTMTDAYLREFRAGNREAARHVIDFYGGPGTLDAFPQKVRDYVIERTSTNVLDWSCGYAFRAPLADYAAISAPTLVVRGEEGHPGMRRIAELLRDAIPRASLVSIAGGTHFLPATHAPQLAKLIAAHVAANRPAHGPAG